MQTMNNPGNPATHKTLCWINGTLLPPEQATISVFDHGLLYGDGVFEGIRFYQKRCFRLPQHLERLNNSAKAISLKIPVNQHQLENAITKTLESSTLNDGFVTRGSGPLGIDPSRCNKPNVIIIVDQLSLVSDAVRQTGASVIIAATRRLNPDGLDPRIKSLNYLNHILARMEANHAGANEAILLNSAGRIAEGSADNIFIVRKHELLTPPTTEGALNGITRQCILELADTLGITNR